MEITKIFANALGYLLLAKARNFVRRSLFLYALASALLAYALHFSNISSIGSINFLKVWGTYFLGFVLIALILLFLSAFIQSRRLISRQITFKEEELILSQGGTQEAKSWDWIISAEEQPGYIAFLVQKRPRLEIFLSKNKLEDRELKVLREWLVRHGKLSVN